MLKVALFLICFFSLDASGQISKNVKADRVDSLFGAFLQGDELQRDLVLSMLSTYPNSNFTTQEIEDILQMLQLVTESNPSLHLYSSRVKMLLGLFFVLNGKENLGHKVFLKILNEKPKSQSDSINRFHVLVQVARLYLISGNPSEAKKLSYEARRLLPNNYSDSTGRSIINLYNNLGIIYFQKENYHLAKGFYKISLQNAINQSDTAWIGILTGNIGACFEKTGDLHSALNFYKEDVRLSLSQNELPSALNALCGIFDIYKELGEPQKANAQIPKIEAIINSGKIIDLGDVLRALNLLQAYYTELNDFKRALNYAELGQKAANISSLRKGELSFSRGLLKAEMESQAENLRLLNENKNAIQRSNKNKRYALVLLLVFCIFLLLSAVIYHSQNIKLIKLNKYLGESKAILQAKNNLLAQQQKELDTQNETLKALNATKDKLFSILAHDLRTPLLNLGELLELLKRDDLSQKEFKKALGVLSSHTHYLNGTIDNILVWVKSQLLGIEPKKTEFLVTELLEELFPIYVFSMKEKGLLLEKKFECNQPVFADRNQIAVVFRNLLANAIKFSLEGKPIVVSVFCDYNTVTINLIDQGPGISDAVLEKIKNRLTHTTFGPNGEVGTGLGLLLCHEFLLKNNGSIEAENNGSGSVFRVLLPVVS